MKTRDENEEDIIAEAEFDSSEEEFLLTAQDRDNSVRVDSVVASRTALSRNAVQKLIAGMRVLCNGRPVSKNYKVSPGDIIHVSVPPPAADGALPEDIPIDIIYEDGDIIIVNKESGMTVHPAPGNYFGTLVNALLWHCSGESGTSLSGIGGIIRPGIVHRIDKDTSGLLVIAKNDSSHNFLSSEIKNHDVRRIYYALAAGSFKNDSGVVDAPIGRHPLNRKKMAVIKNPDTASKNAVTRYQVLQRYPGYTFLKLELETGRTHQIRVHMSFIGHPLLGDTVYGGTEAPFVKKHPHMFDGQCLHAGELHLRHPSTKEFMRFYAPLPDNFIKIIEIMKTI